MVINSSQPNVHARTILLVDDEPLVRGLCRAFLADDYAVLEADVGPSALEVCRQYDGPIHLLLTDLMMPKMNGVELVLQVCQLRPATRVLFMSAYAEPSLRETIVREHPLRFLQKPFTRQSLLAKIRMVLASGD